ncbi:hypothetical protein JCM19992_13190 [Thermostilla marina]
MPDGLTPYTAFSKERIASLIDRFSQVRTAVFGDFFLDKYLEVDPRLEETSVETGQPAHQVVGIRHSPGAAGTVVCNLAALGVKEIHTIGIIGDDGEGYELQRDLIRMGCITQYLHVVPGRATPTYLKPRDIDRPGIAGEHPRYDTKNRTPLSDDLADQLSRSLETVCPQVDAVVVLDQVEEHDCGVVHSKTIAFLPELAGRYSDVQFWGDSRSRIHRFRGVAVKCNRYEAVFGRAAKDDTELSFERLAEAVEDLRRKLNAPLLVSCGADGMLVYDDTLRRVPTISVEGPIDPTGAGDSAMAGCVAARASGAKWEEAALVGNLTASQTICRLGTTGTCSPAELRRAVDAWFEEWGD